MKALHLAVIAFVGGAIAGGWAVYALRPVKEIVAADVALMNRASPQTPDVEVRVSRNYPEELVVTRGDGDEPPFIGVAFKVLDPEELRDWRIAMKFRPDFAGKLFEYREFRLRLPRNVVEGKNRERKNSDGTTTVWPDTEAHWNFEAVMIEAIK